MVGEETELRQRERERVEYLGMGGGLRGRRGNKVEKKKERERVE